MWDEAQMPATPDAEASADTNTDLSTGLSEQEVRARQATYGFNEVPERKPNLWLMFAKKFWGLSAWMIELIIVLSWVLHKYSDVYIVSGLLVVNAILSYAQAQRASGAVEALRRRLKVGARVLRDGKWEVKEARELVPGDVVRVRAGDFVPADISVAEGQLQVDQSALTGESLEVDRGRGTRSTPAQSSGGARPQVWSLARARARTSAGPLS
jgi:H+-transporting ATPase